MNGDPGETKAPEPEAEPANPKPTSRTRVSSEHPLMSDRHSYVVQADVLRKFHTLTSGNDKFVMAEDVEGNGAPSQSASLNVRFWVDNGFLTRDGKSNRYRITPAASRYVVSRALGVDKGRPALYTIIANSWFAQTARTALTTKPLMPREELQGELAMQAGVVYESRKRSLSSLVDMLEEAGIVGISEDGVRLVESVPPPSLEAPVAVAAGAGAPPVPALDFASAIRAAPVLMPPSSGVVPIAPGAPMVAPPIGGVRLTVMGFPGGPSPWRTVTGPGFILQVEPSRKAITWLKRHVELLEAEVEETETSAAQGTDARAAGGSGGGGSNGGGGGSGGVA